MSLNEFRDLMKKNGISAYFIGSADAHKSEYVASSEDRRSYISKFTGSAGTALITLDSALLWTDGRYFLQASDQLSKEWTLMKSGQQPPIPLSEFIQQPSLFGPCAGISCISTDEGFPTYLSPLIDDDGRLLGF